MSELEKLLERKVEIELNSYCKNHLDCSKCKELCAEVKEYNEINRKIEEVTNMSRRWVIADLHFGHTNVIKYSNRPFVDVEQMNAGLIKNWNNVVSKDDTVYVLGDFTLNRKLDLIREWCGKLNGNKVLVMGNHDTRKPADYVACGFRTAIRKPILVEPNVVLMHEPPLKENICEGMIYIFGHVHDQICDADDFDNCYCVSAERIDYKPIDLDKLIISLRK